MCALRCVNEGELLCLKYIVNQTDPGDPILHLFKAKSGSIDDATSLANLTEATEAGYTPFTLEGATWSFAQPAGVSTAVYDQVTFTFTVGCTQLGYYVTDNASSKILWVEEFDGSGFILPGGGGTIAITPKVTCD